VRPALATVACLTVLSLTAACSGDGGEPRASATPTPSVSATTPPASPTVGPSPTASRAVAVPAPGVLSKWKSCDAGFQCATLTVPLDDADTSKGTVALALTRRKATGSRIGSLIINPGGPGASAVEYVQGRYQDFPRVLRQRFDIVAFDPRGVGRTAPVRCLSFKQLDAYFHIDPHPDTAAERTALIEGNRKLANGCQARSGRVLPYVSTRIVAQDLDRVRHAVGDRKLTYLGYSYGTAIGASYLDQYPTRVRAMVLDGALDPSSSWDELLEGQSRGFDVALKAFLADCEKTSCAFREAVDGDLTKAFDDLAAEVEKKDLPGDGERTVGPDEFTLGVGLGLYSRRNGWPAIAQALAEAVRGDGSTLLSLSDAYLDRSENGYKNISEANFAVNCIDRPWPRTEAPYYALAEKVRPKYPRFGPAIALSGIGCSVWPTPAVGKPHEIHAPGMPPVVVIGTTRDPATPYSWSQALAKQLSRGILITHVGDGHTVYRASAPACVQRPVNDYLVSLKTPREKTC